MQTLQHKNPDVVAVCIGAEQVPVLFVPFKTYSRPQSLLVAKATNGINRDPARMEGALEIFPGKRLCGKGHPTVMANIFVLSNICAH